MRCCRFSFSQPLAHVDIEAGTLFFYLFNKKKSTLFQKSVKAAHVIGADGGGSRCRQALKGFLKDKGSDQGIPLGYGYKELSMPLLPDGRAPMDRDTLHIWPRGSHFMMGLANLDGSFTMTLYMSDKNHPVAFDKFTTPEAVRGLFEEYYADAIPLMPDFQQDFENNPVGFLGTVFCEPWVFQDKFGAYIVYSVRAAACIATSLLSFPLFLTFCISLSFSLFLFLSHFSIIFMVI